MWLGSKMKKLKTNLKTPEPETHNLQMSDNLEQIPKKCPKCNSKILSKSVKRTGNILKQSFKCKNKKCKFEKEITITI